VCIIGFQLLLSRRLCTIGSQLLLSRYFWTIGPQLLLSRCLWTIESPFSLSVFDRPLMSVPWNWRASSLTIKSTWLKSIIQSRLLSSVLRWSRSVPISSNRGPALVFNATCPYFILTTWSWSLWYVLLLRSVRTIIWPDECMRWVNIFLWRFTGTGCGSYFTWRTGFMPMVHVCL